MIKIRLRTTGRKRINTFSIVVIDSRKGRNSTLYLAKIGYYRPQFKSDYCKVDIASYNQWIATGAQPTARVVKLFKIYSDSIAKGAASSTK